MKLGNHDDLRRAVTNVSRIRAEVKAAQAAEEAAARTQFHREGGACWTCRDTGWRVGSLHEPCVDCGRGAAVVEQQRRLHLSEMIQAAGLPPRRAEQTLQNFPRPFQEGYNEVCDLMRLWDGTTGLALVGEKGRGKTGLLVGAVRAAADFYLAHGQHGARITYTTGGDLFDRLREGYSDGTHSAQMSALQRMPLLAIDDLGVERVNEWVLDRLYMVVNARYEANLPIFFTSNYDTDTLKARVGMRVLDRLVEMCDIIAIRGVNLRYWLRGLDEPSGGMNGGMNGEEGESK